MKAEISLLQTEIDQLSERYERLQKESNKANKDATAPEQLPIEEHPDLTNHQYFEELINGIMIKGITEQERLDKEKLEGHYKRRKLAREKNVKDYEALKSQFLDKVQLESCYRLGGITAFPVNDPSADDEDRFLGIRFDTYDVYSGKYTTPHYIILKKRVKTNDWYVFKTTVPNFIPVNALSTQFLNTEMFKFVSEIRRHLILLQVKKSVFGVLSLKLQTPSRLDSDLSFTKVNINVQNKFEIVLICGEKSISSVIVIGDKDQSGGLLTKVTRRKLELAFRGCKYSGFEKQFFEILKNCQISI
ncbi:hypothetical protein FOA43_000322 [Brettanomyces nanus]|uniref:Uncharacterized protein n=1 Tax=Eeniella nana TaxID=13502 RepID=A0A875RWU7_EENNA|nr:uncharacterized protein FOA43_000322 [Brettanomyces nanus]QPG73018.1 hypothetical protein FOA43_000322 [Brettanomyces nanus]